MPGPCSLKALMGFERAPGRGQVVVAHARYSSSSSCSFVVENGVGEWGAG